jgi:porin
MTGRRIALAGLVSAALAMQMPAHAETMPSSSTQKLEQGGVGSPSVTGAPPPVGPGLSVPGESPNFLFNFTGLAAPIGKAMADHGFYIHGVMQNSMLGVVDGGHKGGAYFGLSYFGFDIDTEKMFGLPGGLFDVTASGQTGNTATGTNTTGSGAFTPYAFGDEVRLVNFNYTQSFWDHKLQIQLGRMMSGYTSTPYLSPGIHQTFWYCSFFSVSCGNSTAFAMNSSKAPYEVGSWGANITVHPAPFWYVKGGVYENQPLEVTSHDHLGWPSRDWGFNEAQGAFFPLQLGYITTPGTSLYPTNAHIGGYYDTAQFPDKYYNAKHLVAATNPGAPLLDRGTAGVFFGIQQTVYRFSSNPKSARGVSLFMTGDWDLHSKETAQQQYAVGTIITGLFPSRAADTFDVLFSPEILEGRFIANRNAIAKAHGVNYTLGRVQTVTEVNYGFALAPGATIFPFVQYITNPDQANLPVPDPKDTHSFAVGMRLVMRFDVMIGLPQPG